LSELKSPFLNNSKRFANRVEHQSNTSFAPPQAPPNLLRQAFVPAPATTAAERFPVFAK